MRGGIQRRPPATLEVSQIGGAPHRSSWVHALSSTPGLEGMSSPGFRAPFFVLEPSKLYVRSVLRLVLSERTDLAFSRTPFCHWIVPVGIVPVWTALAFGPILFLGSTSACWNSASLLSYSCLELDGSSWIDAGLWSDSFWNQAVPVEIVLFRNFSLWSREKPPRNGIPVIKIFWAHRPPHPHSGVWFDV